MLSIRFAPFVFFFVRFVVKHVPADRTCKRNTLYLRNANARGTAFAF
jgi:hypothetical protein